MKVFKYDTTTGTKGEMIGEIPRADGMGLIWSAEERKYISYPHVVMPRHPNHEEWAVFGKASNRDGAITYDEPVCFCIGQLGSEWDWQNNEARWNWTILMPATRNFKNDRTSGGFGI
jgi:hypothetical protein